MMIQPHPSLPPATSVVHRDLNTFPCVWANARFAPVGVKA